MRNKKLLLYLLALNTMTSVFSNANPMEKLSSRIIKNIEKGKSTNEGYKLIEKILNKKNKELKDLYAQNDYIIKPEYLEWQIFFSGDYSETKKGDNTQASAVYNTDSSKRNGKVFGTSQTPKRVDLGITVPVKSMSRDPLSLNIGSINMNVVNPNIVTTNVEIPVIDGDVGLQTFSPISAVTPPDLSRISINWPRTSTTGITATVSSGSTVTNAADSEIIYNVSSGSGLMNSSGYYIQNGTVINDGKIQINYDGPGNPGGGVTSSNTFHGIWSQSNQKARFVNNGEFNIYTNLADNGGDVGSVMGIHFWNHATADTQVIENYGTVRVKQAIWMQFEDSEGTYLSHAADGRVGNVIVDEGSQGLQVWRCCYTDGRDNDSIAYLDPGIVVVRGQSTGINIVEAAQGMRSEIVNNNLTNDKSKDSQLIVESGNGLVFTISTAIKAGLYEEVNIPIYQTGAGTNGLIVIDGTSNGSPGWNTNGRGRGVVHLGTGAKIEIRTPGNMTERTTGIYTNAAQAIDNEGTVSNMTTEAYSVTLNDGTVLNYDAQPDGSKNTVGVYITKNNGMPLNTEILSGETEANIHYRQNGGSIRIGGENSVALYNNNDIVKITNNAEIEASNGAVGIYTRGNGSAGSATTIINNANLTAGNKSLLFYNEGGGQVDFQGTTTALIKSGATAFYSKGTTALTDYLNIGNLTVKMEDNSTLLMLEEPLVPIYLNALPGVTGINIDPSSSTNYKKVSQYRGSFFINKNVSLNDNSDDYVQTSLISTKTELMQGFSITGSDAGQVGIKTGANAAITTNSEVSAINEGIINLTGDGAVGLYTNYGTNKNNNTLNVSGTKGVGIFAENGSVASNTGEIRIGNKGIGIYAVSYQDTSPEPLFGDKKINVTNTGTITAGAGSQAVGIYLNNNKGLTTGEARLDLGTGTIDVKSSDNGVGVYANKIGISGGGTITVGNNGIGIYAKDSDINLSNLTLNLHGDNALGLYLEGNTNLSGTGNIDIDGRNVILYNIVSSGTINADINVTGVTVGSSYIIGNVSNSNFYYNRTANLGSNGVLVNGLNSAVLIGSDANITSTGTGVVAVVLNGTNSNIPGTINGTVVSAEGTNKGIISLGDQSAGLYGINGARLNNENIITVGKDSIALYSEGSNSSVINSGTVSIGENSQAIFNKDGSFIENAGIIQSDKLNTIGIYSENSGFSTLSNTNLISLTNDNSIGMYTSGSGTQNINNSGVISVGDSSDISNPNMGIYNVGVNNIISNSLNGEIKAGDNSIAIYSDRGLINNDGTLALGSSATGIYSNGGTVSNNGKITFGNQQTVGIYGINNAVISSVNADMNIKDNNYAYILESGSTLNNTGNTLLGSNSVFVYGNGNGNITNNIGSNIAMNGSDNIGFYLSDNTGTLTNDGDITGDTGTANIGIYAKGGNVHNAGNISLGDSVIIDKFDLTKNKYSIGIYTENADMTNIGNISVGENGVGLFSKAAPNPVINMGNITSNGANAIGIIIQQGEIHNSGTITMNGNDSIGIAANVNSKVLNTGTININGDNGMGIYANINTKVENNGIININGNNSTGIQLSNNSVLENKGTIDIKSGTINSKTVFDKGTGEYPIPTLINAGVINVGERFENDGMTLIIKVDPSTLRTPTASDLVLEGLTHDNLGAKYLISNSVKIKAPSFGLTGPVKIAPDFTQGTNLLKYKLDGVFEITTPEGGPNSGTVDVVSKSLTWEATPEVEGTKLNIWMEKIAYKNFTDGLWYEEFGNVLDKNYEDATGNALAIYDKIDLIENESDFRKVMGSLAGNIYSNINQREDETARSFENSLDILQNSENNTKENVKINVIAGKGKTTEETDGVVGYNFTKAGIQALREVERTYRHTFGYSLGYLHTGFEFKDGNESKEKVDTIQLGIHNKYSLNNWILKNDLTGRISFHNIDRNIVWPSKTGKSELTGNYETYSITSNNKLGKEFDLGKRMSITPYGGVRAMYAIRPTFKEKGLEALKVEGNDAWSIKPQVGIELKSIMPLGKKENWKLKGSLDMAYEYELANLNTREKAKLTSIGDEYHKLSKPEEEKGVFRTKAYVGVEIEDRYGIFLTGEYRIKEHDKNDYRAGVSVKAVF